jgi:hypothetical protein
MRKRRFFVILLGLALMLGLMTGMSMTAKAEESAAEGTAWDGGDGHNTLPTDKGVYYLTSDINVRSSQDELDHNKWTWNIAYGENVTLERKRMWPRPGRLMMP